MSQPEVRSDARPTSARRGVRPTYTRVRSMILDGVLPPGHVINQVTLSQELGVSRTPLREALRMLQAQGLIQAEPRRQMRVPPVEAHEIDTLYAHRILLESVAVAITLPNLDAREFRSISRRLDAMHAEKDGQSMEDWERLHTSFHELLTGRAQPSLREAIASYSARSERYRRMYLRVEPLSWDVARDEHSAIARAVKRRDVEDAVNHLSRHLARTALVLIGSLAPETEPLATRQALRLTAPTHAHVSSSPSQWPGSGADREVVTNEE